MNSQQNFPLAAVAAAPNDILSWTNQDSRESVLFNSWGVLYRFQVCVHRMWKSWRDRSSDYPVDRGSEWSNRYYYVAHTSSQQRRSRREARMVREWWLRSRRDGKGRSDLHRARGTTISHSFFFFF